MIVGPKPGNVDDLRFGQRQRRIQKKDMRSQSLSSHWFGPFMIFKG